MNTQNTEKKKINWFRTIRPIALMLVLVMLLTYATYSWMKRDWTPDVHEENIKIVAGSSLVFLFDGKSQGENVSIDDLVHDFEDFVFKSVSNCSGNSDDFFALKYDARGEYFDKFKHISMEEEKKLYPDLGLGELYSAESRMDYTMLGKNHGYIELTFQVKAPVGESKYVMLDPSSVIKASNIAENETGERAVAAMRVSITVPDTSVGAAEGATKTIIYVPKVNSVVHGHKGVTNNLAVSDNVFRYLQSGEEGYDSQNPTLRKNVNSNLVVLGNPDVRTLLGPEEKNGYDDNKVEDDYYLFTLDDSGNPRQIIVRIWLEGEDENCTDDKILGGELDILVKFDAEEIA